MRRNRLISALGLTTILTACVPSYRHQAPLAYADVPYTSTEGKPWPAQFVTLPHVQQQYDLRAEPRVCYVELNPEGKRTVIFVHGLGSYLKFWQKQLDVFAAQGYRVLALDMIGYGKSDKPASFPYTMEAMADVVRIFAQKMGAERPILIGHSMGGQTALSYAIRYPNALGGLVLTSPAGFEYFSPRDKAWFKRVFTVGLIRSTSEAGLWGTIRYNNFYRWRSNLEWLIEERLRTSKNPEFGQYAYANVRSVHGLADNDFVRGSLQHVKAPTLIIHGDRDRLIPNPYLHGGDTRDIMEYGHAKISGSKLTTLANCGHTVQMDCWEDYNSAVLAFVADLAGP